MTTPMLSNDQMVRYSRQILLRQIGGVGQRRLAAASVFILGAGGLGSPAACYLAAAGVGHLVIADGDRVELSNLQRQILHATDRIGLLKTESAARTLRAINPEVRITAFSERIDENNMQNAIAGCDLIVDGSDNFATRYLLNRAAKEAGKVLISGAVLGFEGQIATFRHGVDPAAPCYRCLYPIGEEAAGNETVPTCATAGVLGAVTGVVGSWQAAEAIKELLGIGASLAGSLMLINLLDGIVHRVRMAKDPGCPVCA
ncbi:MAG: HesA/MoeB/ThiF family protein [Magnetococcales bacterium]|nr:HesA/MoeB/ThiF family protein [Magnetococcales bacterium]